MTYKWKFHRFNYFLCFIFFSLCINSFALQDESEHFIYTYQPSDKSVIDTIKSTLEYDYYRITGDLKVTFQNKVRVNIYPSLQQFHNAIGWPDASDWIIGTANSQIYIVSPLNPGPVHHYSEFFEYVLVHEFTHVCTNKINYNLPSWLSEGYACYESGPKCDHNDLVDNYEKLGKIPSIDDLSGTYDQFVKYNGYDFSFILVKYLVEKFGLETVRKFISSPDDFSIFDGYSKSQIEKEWHSYLISNYIEGNEIVPGQCASDFNLFPNPVISRFSIEYKSLNPKFLSLIIYNNQGKAIKNFSGINEFDISELPAGLYHFKFNSGDFIKSGKIVKK